ncbi:MAG: hybrid sensor histidine kinase/response regulator [Brevundimonas sp.]|uniref:ATP-binding protein n=1 Tax=Brevundimonas sp. TaxID=1871086 RepID=UPI000DB30597|nr:ATP-binding protein [Brevundimonas sp.]PZU75704.1 MAG: hybrid sensor histidine kinase/response regulator [Brevundimonas sp.]
MTKSTELDNDDAVWTVALRQRRGALPQRAAMGVAIAMVVSPLIGWTGSLLWAAIYIAIQLLEQVIFSPAARATPAVLPRWRKALGLAAISSGALFFGFLSVPMWLTGGAAGAICAALITPAALLFVMINTPRSKAILIANVAPYFFYMAAIPMSAAAYDAPASLVIGATAAVAAFFLYIVLGWRKMSEAIEKGLSAKAEADRLRLKAEQDLAAHTVFLAAVGHDLRTPIGAILTGAAEIQNHDAQTRANVDLITDAGLMMKALLDDLLDHSKIGAGRMTVETVDFDLRKLLAQTIRLWRGPVEAKGLKLRLESTGGVPRAVRGDPMRLRQVLNNLISNAVKFTETGTITLRLDAWSEEPGGYLMLIEVADTGPGMSVDQLTRLFNPFDQTQEGVSARHGGSGLGLAISRDLVELMGGRLTARSAPGQGARFTVSLFLAAGAATAVAETPIEGLDESRLAVARALVAPSQPLAPAAPPVAPPAPAAVEQEIEPPSRPAAAEGEPQEEEDRPLRLLVVDDHDINRRAVQLILQPLGCEITTAADGMIALDRCAETVFDVIFMDVRMPELDGRETTRRLRAGDGPNARTPVIAVTADTAPEDIAACQAAGMAYFVSKPLTPPALLGALQHVLSEIDDQAADEAA